MTKKIKILRDATLYTHRIEGKAFIGPANVPLREGDKHDLKEPAQKIGNNPPKYEVHLSQGYVYLFEGADFEFI